MSGQQVILPPDNDFDAGAGISAELAHPEAEHESGYVSGSREQSDDEFEVAEELEGGFP
jgi:hypothetical protein